MSDDILEPLTAYNSKYKNLHLEQTERFFDELTKMCKVDVEQNAKTCDTMYKKEKEVQNLDKKLRKNKTIKILLISLSVILGLVSILLLFSGITNEPKSVPLIIVGAILPLLIVLFIFIIVKKLNPIIKHINEVIDKINKEIEALKKQAYKEMAVLNSSYDWGMSQVIITESIPLINMDLNFDIKKYQYLYEKYKLVLNPNKNVSTIFCQSGEILGNPFLIVKDVNQTMVNKTYTGTKTIHWTTRVKTKDGYTTRHHSQTLVASISKPAPVYKGNTYLVYGNDAAPNLSFSRVMSEANSMDEKDIDKFVKKRSKELDKMAEEAVKTGKTFNKLNNDEFEALFNATDRDNEIEFRLLFTPLAQKNMINLIKSKKPFGDDFNFIKEKQLNYIASVHSQKADYYARPTSFIHFDHRVARKKFIDYNVEYFKNLFFDLAPLLSVPLYQLHQSTDHIYDTSFGSNTSPYEHEVMANSFNHNLLKHKQSNTQCIIKTKQISKVDDFDEVEITAHSFKAERRVTRFTKLGGDGRLHSIPVYWYEFIPLENVSRMVIQNKNSSRLDFNSNSQNQGFQNLIKTISKHAIYERGLFACLLSNNSNFSKTDANSLNNVYKTNNFDKIKPEDKFEKLLESIQNELNDNYELEKSFEEVEFDLSNEEAKEIEATSEDIDFDNLNSVNEEITEDDEI